MFVFYLYLIPMMSESCFSMFRHAKSDFYTAYCDGLWGTIWNPGPGSFPDFGASMPCRHGSSTQCLRHVCLPRSWLMVLSEAIFQWAFSRSCGSFCIEIFLHNTKNKQKVPRFNVFWKIDRSSLDSRIDLALGLILAPKHNICYVSAQGSGSFYYILVSIFLKTGN